VLITPLCDDEASRIAQRFESGGTAVRSGLSVRTSPRRRPRGTARPAGANASAEHATERRYSRRRLDTHPTAGRGDGGRRGVGSMTASDATGPATVPDGATARFVRRPAITSSVVALAAGGVAVALVAADTALQREILRFCRRRRPRLRDRCTTRSSRWDGPPGSGCADRARWRSRRSRRGGDRRPRSPRRSPTGSSCFPGLWVCGRSPRRLRRSGSGGVGP